MELVREVTKIAQRETYCKICCLFLLLFRAFGHLLVVRTIEVLSVLVT